MKYNNFFRDKRKNASKAYQPPNAWPVLCNHSAPPERRAFAIEEKWVNGSGVCVELTAKLSMYPKYQFLSKRIGENPELASSLAGFDKVLNVIKQW
ncbi:hypothetical protein [Amycolatopsis magusensis]|uniref:hypothetical protein n=1 Tax=Amycolatopsis magusensis TaxID=882444 RepID=UPI003799ABD9